MEDGPALPPGEHAMRELLPRSRGREQVHAAAMMNRLRLGMELRVRAVRRRGTRGWLVTQ